jgi:DNA invertase Pin-like site-specific DNA recombinase
MSARFNLDVSEQAREMVSQSMPPDTGLSNTAPGGGLLIGQRDALLGHGVDPEYLFEEHISGVKSKRPQLENCLRVLRRGDVLVVWRLDRLGRSIIELVTIARDLADRGIELRSLTESIDTTTAGGRLVFNVFAAVAQFERDIISERTRAGLKAARLRGHKGGRKPKLNDKDRKLLFKLLDDPTYTQTDAAKLLGISRATVYRELKMRQRPADKKALDQVVQPRAADK